MPGEASSLQIANADKSAERLALFRLSLVDGLGPMRLRQLLAKFGSAEAVFSAQKSRIEAVDGIGPVVAEAILQSTLKEATAAYERMIGQGIRLIYESDAEYPAVLKEIPSAPMSFAIKGALVPRDRLAIAVVGSRRCSAYGRKIAERLAHDLASKGITVVSGLARGIDAAAHAGALKAGGRTLAVLASGLGNIYPPEHKALGEEVAAQGALISEAPLDGPPIGGLFPQRNRIISGLSIGVVVVEAATRSGALSTANHALEQNREVFAVPGRVGDAASEGTNELIRKGATLVRHVDDILEQIGPVEVSTTSVSVSEKRTPPPGLDGKQQQLWDALGEDEVELETLLERTGLRASEASSALLLLEMRKAVRRLPGNRYQRR